jgi:tetratricopeptide (TPR) repeat protein
MKPSSGRAPCAAAFKVSAAILCSMTLSMLPSTQAHAQRVSAAVADGTPRIDAAITSRNWTAALSQLDTRIKTHPHDAQAKFKRGTMLAHLNRDSEAIQQFVELTQAYPELPEPYNNLAALYAKAGRYDDARAALETAVKAHPSYSLAYENLGDLYIRLAAESYKRAQALGHASGEAAQRLADLQKIIFPPPAAKKAAAAIPSPASPRAFPYNPAVLQFGGGSNSPLAMPPYVAPSQ